MGCQPISMAVAVSCKLGLLKQPGWRLQVCLNCRATRVPLPLPQSAAEICQILPGDMPSTHSHSISAPWLSRPSTEVAPDLVGCTLVRRLPNGAEYRGLIVETEAYAPNDPACHAYRRRTARNEVMFGPAGACYVYLIYGIYHCLNVVTDQDSVPSAVLIRALDLRDMPDWLDAKQTQKPHRIAAGPGKLCRALKIDLSLNGSVLQPAAPLALEPRTTTFQRQLEVGQTDLVQTTRIGLSQGVEYPWRWYLQGCPAVSKK